MPRNPTCASGANDSLRSGSRLRAMCGATTRTVASGISILSLTACTAPTRPSMGCWLDATVGYATVSAHYPTCPAPLGVASYDFEGRTFTVRWD